MIDTWKQYTKMQFREYLEQKRSQLFVGQKTAMSYAVRKLTMEPPSGKGMSLQAIADKAWVDRSYLSRVLAGSRHPKKYVWFRIGFAGGYNDEEMVQFMKAAGYGFDKENMVDVLLLYCMGQHMDLSQIADFFILFEDMGINCNIVDEVFGKN